MNNEMKLNAVPFHLDYLKPSAKIYEMIFCWAGNLGFYKMNHHK